MTPEESAKRTKSLLAQHVVSADVDVALLCVAELNRFLPKVVEAIFGMVLDNAKPKEKELLFKLIVALRTEEAIARARPDRLARNELNYNELRSRSISFFTISSF